MISLCTPTYNRRLFIDTMIKCVMQQTYTGPLEWIIVDDGEDKIGDLVQHIPFVKYYAVDRMTIGAKRNLMHKYAIGDIIIYIDDDDYYPPERIQHVVDSLNTTICGSSIMYMYFTNLDKIYKFGPYGPNHATAATFGFKRKLLNQTAYNNNDEKGEEKFFLKKWSIPLKQLDPKKTILVISHNKNTVDKNKLLKHRHVEQTNYKLENFVKDPQIISFYRNLKNITK